MVFERIQHLGISALFDDAIDVLSSISWCLSSTFLIPGLQHGPVNSGMSVRPSIRLFLEFADSFLESAYSF